VAVGGILIFGFVTSWIFGREFSDRTVKDLLALPVSRNCIVGSKFVLVFLWCALLCVLVILAGLAVGRLMDLPGWSPEVARQGLSVFGLCSFLTIALSPPVALFASVGRGYMPPLGFLVFALVFAQLVAATGRGHLICSHGRSPPSPAGSRAARTPGRNRPACWPCY